MSGWHHHRNPRSPENFSKIVPGVRSGNTEAILQTIQSNKNSPAQLALIHSFARHIWPLTQCARHPFAFCRSLELALGLQLGCVIANQPLPRPQNGRLPVLHLFFQDRVFGTDRLAIHYSIRAPRSISRVSPHLLWVGAHLVFDFRSGRNRLLRIERRKALDHGYPAEFLVGRDKHRYQAGPF